MKAIQFLQIEPTTRCNFTCRFCAGRSLEQLDMDFSYFRSLIDAIDGVEHIELQGEGEPLIHPYFFDMLGYLKEKHPNVKSFYEEMLASVANPTSTCAWLER